MKKGETDVVADGRVVLVCVKRENFQSVQVPAEIVRHLSPYVAE